MCFTLSRVRTTGHWNWEGDIIVHDPVISRARRTPNRNHLYDIDIREFLNTKANEVVNHQVRNAIDHLRASDQALFRSHQPRSFDFRAQVMTRYLYEHFPYIPGEREFDFWLYPDETIAEGGGDCEDRAILLAALLLASGLSGYVVRVALGKLYNVRTKESRDHAWVMYRNEDGRWLCLEPLLHSKKARRAARSGRLPGLMSLPDPYEYVPYFVFNDSHLWAMRQNVGDAVRGGKGGFDDYLQARSYWREFDPSFAASVHCDIFDYALTDMSDTDLLYVKACSLALDCVSTYDPREHFDNGYIDEGWQLVREYLADGSLNTLTYALHAIADFYAHSSYPVFGPVSNGVLTLYDDMVATNLQVCYDAAPFDLNDTTRFSVNPHYYKSPTRAQAIAHSTNKQIISGRFGQTGDPHQGFLEKVCVNIPYDMRHAPDFPLRGGLPHHNEITVDGPLTSGGAIPGDHRLYQTPAEYQAQFTLRFEAAKTHVAKEYQAWKQRHHP